MTESTAFQEFRRTGRLDNAVYAATGETTTRSPAAHAADVYNLLDRGAAGDGTTDDSTSIQTAVTSAVSDGKDLYWPAGTYLTTVSITNLHSVRHFGPGVLKRGTDTFTLSPTDGDTNIIYVASTGSDTNDGLTSSQPFATLQAAINILTNYGGVLRGTWRFQLAASTITEDGIAVPNLMYANNPVQIYGPDVSGGTPTAIFDGTGSTSTAFTANRKCEIYLRDIKFQTYGANNVVRISQLSDVDCENIHIDGGAKGIAADELSKLRIRGGIIDNCTTGVDVRQANASVGLDGSYSGPTVQNCTTGVAILENSNAHVDDMTIDTCTTGLLVSENARATLNGTVDFTSNTTAVQGQEGARIEYVGTVDFNDNTASANTINEQYYGIVAVNGSLPLFGRTSVSDPTSSSHTGDTNETTLQTFTNLVRSNTFVFSGKSLRFRFATKKTGSAATATMKVKVGSNAIATWTMPSAAAEGSADIYFVARSSTTQRTQQKITDENGLIDDSFANQSFTLDDTVGDLNATITVQLGNSGDTVEVNNHDIYETG